MRNLPLSIIMPALNEDENIIDSITNALKALEDFNIDGEIIVVNDGSTDNTENLVRNVVEKDKRVKIISHKTSKGIGASFWYGVDNANGDVITMIPGDNENYPWETLRYLDLLNHVDIVIPFVFNKEVRSLFRNALSFVYRVIINSTFMVNFNYTNGTVLFRKSILKDLTYRSERFFFQTDILIRTVKKGYLFAEVPYKLGLRKGGKSKATSFPSLLQIVKGYLRLVKDCYLEEKILEHCFTKDSMTMARRSNIQIYSKQK